MNILITNDDGINSEGLLALATKFSEIAEVIVVAPDTQKSATSHSITTTVPLRSTKHNLFRHPITKCNVIGYSINGTPADCVKFAILHILKNNKPDLVLAGINHGRNTGINVMYSGTIAGATEGHLLGIPSLAISVATHNTSFDCSAAADYAFDIVSKLIQHPDKSKFFLNINVPAVPKSAINGIKVVKCSDSYWEDEYERRIDPFGSEYFWFNGSYLYDTNDTDTDDVVIDNGFVAVTPMQIRFTNDEQIDTIKYLETPSEEIIQEIMEEAFIETEMSEDTANTETASALTDDDLLLELDTELPLPDIE